MPYRSAFRPGLFLDETHVVTGGGSGIGRAVAHELASLGARVVLVGRKQEKLDRVAAELLEDGATEVGTQAFDIRDEEAVRLGIKVIVGRFGPIQGLVNNAGGQFPMPLAGINKKGFEAVVANNLTGGFLVAREVFTQSMKKHGGAIVNMLADMWGGMPGMGHSGAAREGMKNLTETMAVEWASAGVRVNAVAPGFVASSGFDSYDPAFTNDFLPRLVAEIPLSRFAEEDEVAAAITFLLSPAAAFVTGTTIRIDGGASLNRKAFPLPRHARAPRLGAFHRAVPPQAMVRLGLVAGAAPAPLDEPAS